MKIIRALIIVALTPFALFIGLVGCVNGVADLMHAHAAPAPLYCSASTTAAWSHGWNLKALPVAPCIMQSDTGAYRCSRKDGCNKCGPYPCPELGIKGPQT